GGYCCRRACGWERWCPIRRGAIKMNGITGEPIVNSPFDAIRTFYTSGLDALILDRYLIAKMSPNNRTINTERTKVTLAEARVPMSQYRPVPAIIVLLA